MPLTDMHPQDSIQILFSILWPWFQEWLKKSNWVPWLSQETPKLNKWLSPLIAVLATAGFHLSGNAHDGWVLAIPPLTALTHIAVQWTTQHVVYATVIEQPRRVREIHEAQDHIKQAITGLARITPASTSAKADAIAPISVEK